MTGQTTTFSDHVYTYNQNNAHALVYSQKKCFFSIRPGRYYGRIRYTVILTRGWVLPHPSTFYLYASVFTTQIGLQRRSIRRSKLLDRSRNNSSCHWPARLAHKNSRTLVVRLLQTIHPTKCQGYLFCGKRARKSLHSDRLSIVVR